MENITRLNDMCLKLKKHWECRFETYSRHLEQVDVLDHFDNDTVIVYKILHDTLYSPYKGFKWEYGLNVSSRKDYKYLDRLPYELYEGEVVQGFHAFTSEEDAKAYMFRVGWKKFYHVYPVFVKEKDIVAFGSLNLSEVAFSKGVLRRRYE